MTLDEAMAMVSEAAPGMAGDAFDKVSEAYTDDDAEIVLPWLAELSILIDTEGAEF